MTGFFRCLGEALRVRLPAAAGPRLVSSLPAGSAVREAEVGVSAARRDGGPGGRRRRGDVGQRRLRAGPEGQGESQAAAVGGRLLRGALQGRSGGASLTPGC